MAEGKTYNVSLSGAIEWPSLIRTKEMMEYIKKHYKTEKMEKKKMTKKEAFEYLKDRKIYVNGKSAEIQKKLFEVGFTWTKGQLLSYEGMPFLYTSVNGGTLIHGSSMRTFSTTCNSEISAEEILSIEIVEEKPKHDEELYKLAQPIREYMRKHNILGRVVVSPSYIAVEDLRFIYPNTSED